MSSDFELLRESLAPPTPSEAAADMMNPHDAEARRRGTTLLANAPFGGAEVYVEWYADRLDPGHADRERNPLVLAALVKALARHGEPGHAQIIASYLTHESKQVRWEAAKGLQRLHDPQVAGALRDTLLKETEEPEVRVAAAEALGQYPEDRVFQALWTGLNARELSINLASLRSMRTLTGQDFGEDGRAWLNWYNATSEPFAGRQEYLYPTYSRDETFLEQLAFWTENHWEEPQQPAGLRPSGERSTYDDADRVGVGNQAEGDLEG